MITSTREQLAGLDNFLTDIWNSATKNVSINATIPTPLGPVNFNPLDRAGTTAQANAVANAVRNAVRNAHVSVNASASASRAPAPSDPVAQVHDFVSTNIPGGWLTVVAGLVGGYLLLKRKG